jgi:predicted nuclease of predicted toxin-antitoxin system
MEYMEIPKNPKNPIIYNCENCNFNTCHKNDYKKHLLTSKHQNSCFGNEMELNGNKLTQKNPKKPILFICVNCSKEYKDRSGLWKHNKNCKNNFEIDTKNEGPTDKEIMMIVVQQNAMLIKENQEFKNLILEIVKKDTTINNNNNNNINSHNKTFNLQFFLNETCKDAMNIMDFVDSIKIQLSDLEKVGKIGFVEGISNIIVKNLNSLDETKRPVHCTDSKREVIYIKDEDKWEKENETKVKLRKAIKYVAHKNSKMLSEFRTKNPDCLKSTSKVSDKYNKLVIEALGGKGDNDAEKEDKIIKNIAKEVTIEK